MNKRKFLKALAAMAAVIPIPALAKKPNRPTNMKLVRHGQPDRWINSLSDIPMMVGPDSYVYIYPEHNNTHEVGPLQVRNNPMIINIK